MRLRIYRSYHWELDCSRSEIRYGGDNPMKLVATDQLQQLVDGDWLPIDVVEGIKPLPPETQSERRYREAAERGTTLGAQLLRTAKGE